MIANTDQCTPIPLPLRSLQPHFHRCLRYGKSNSISDDVLNCTTDQVLITYNSCIVYCNDIDATSLLLCFKVCVVSDTCYQFGQCHTGWRLERGERFELGYSQDSANHLTQLLKITMHSIQYRISIYTPSQDIKGNSHPCEWGPKFMGHVIQQLTLAVNQVLGLIRHAIEVPCEITEFVSA